MKGRLVALAQSWLRWRERRSNGAGEAADTGGEQLPDRTRGDHSSNRDERRPTIAIVRKRADRGQQIVDDPDSYFDAARERAAKQVERDLEREHLAEA